MQYMINTLFRQTYEFSSVTALGTNLLVHLGPQFDGMRHAAVPGLAARAARHA